MLGTSLSKTNVGVDCRVTSVRTPSPRVDTVEFGASLHSAALVRKWMPTQYLRAVRWYCRRIEQWLPYRGGGLFSELLT